MNKYLEVAGNIHLSYYVEAAEKLGISYEIIMKGLIARFQSGDKFWFVINTVVPVNSSPSTTIAKRKNLTNLVLKKAGIPVPIQADIKSEEEAIEFFNQYGKIVLKPKQNIGGHGVSILPKTEQDVRDAYKEAFRLDKSKEGAKVLGEEFVSGNNYRLLVIGDKVIGIVHRVPARVIGDGLSNIKDLIAETNIRRREKGLMAIPIDLETETKLKEQGLSLESIPAKDQVIKLRFNANLTTGGTSEECADSVDEYYKNIAVNAVKAIGLKFGGVDLIAEDVTKPNMKCAINEINHNPGLRLHYKPDNGKIVEVAIPIMEYIRDNI